MKKTIISISLLLASNSLFAIPTITHKPELVAPNILDWGVDRPPSPIDLTEPTSNRINDIHSDVKDCDIVLSTSGNYHMALSEIWYDHFLKNNPRIGNWIYTTSPPVSFEHIQSGELSAGNWRTGCRPDVAVGPIKLMNKLQDARLVKGDPIPFIQNQGNVLLVRAGNPKNIQTIWDLGRDDVRVVTSNPDSEPGSFGNYSKSIFNIALNDDSEASADVLFNRVFNNNNNKWVAGHRIHHREVPQAIKDGHADAGMMFYHLALYIKNRFPNDFDIVPLGGSVESPQPMAGNKVGTLYIARIKGRTRFGSYKLREYLISKLLSDDFTDILHKHGLLRPADFYAESDSDHR